MHNEQQTGLQFAAIQHQNPPTSLFLLLCDDEWKILPTGPVADAGSPWCLVTGILVLIASNLTASHPLACACHHLDFLRMTATFYIRIHKHLRISESSTPASKVCPLLSCPWQPNWVSSTPPSVNASWLPLQHLQLKAIGALVSPSLRTYLCAANPLCLQMKPPL
ncbi:hypothetical protein N7527_009275 [Penicillium freii]|nr:hypothetical protein N7527_009275 [Penicillium freii]